MSFNILIRKRNSQKFYKYIFGDFWSWDVIHLLKTLVFQSRGPEFNPFKNIVPGEVTGTCNPDVVGV